MKPLTRISTIALVGAALALAGPTPASAQKAGQSAKITIGVVVQTERVQMQSEAAKSAVVGGIIG